MERVGEYLRRSGGGGAVEKQRPAPDAVAHGASEMVRERFKSRDAGGPDHGAVLVLPADFAVQGADRSGQAGAGPARADSGGERVADQPAGWAERSPWPGILRLDDLPDGLALPVLFCGAAPRSGERERGGVRDRLKPSCASVAG